MKQFIDFLSKLSFWTFILFFTLLAVITTECLIIMQTYISTGKFFDSSLLTVGLIISSVNTFLIFIVVALVLKHLKSVQKDKDNLLVDLKEKSELLRTVIDENPDPVIVKNWEGKFILANAACAELYGTTTEDMLGKDDGDFIPDKEQAKFFKKNVQEIMSKGLTEVVYEESIDVESGERRNYKSVKIPYKNSKNESQILVVAHDITEQKKREEELKFMNYALDRTSEANFLIDKTGKFLRVNEAASKNLGYSKKELSCMHVFDIDQSLVKDKWNEEFEYIKNHNALTREMVYIRKDGTTYFAEVNVNYIEYHNEEYHLVFVRDISDKKEQQRKLEHLAHYDALTNLPNRVVLADRIEQSMAESQRRGNLIAVAYIDLDGFKEVNDTFGHDVGDKLLQTLSFKMKKLLRQGDTIARLGGDEFVALLVDIVDKNAVSSFLDGLLHAISSDIIINLQDINVSASIGVVFYSQDKTMSPEQLIRQADRAMYQAKILGKNRYVFFDDSKELTQRKYQEEHKKIEKALKNQEFELYYQPKVNIKTGEILGAEALIRWNDEVKGVISPDAFLPLVEDDHLSVEIDKWVLNQSLQELQKWQSQGLKYTMNVNIGAKTLPDINFVDMLKIMLGKFVDVDASFLMLEILETSALKNLDHISDIIKECSQLGVRFSLDDFGTGYSSLTYLKHLRVSEIKIDRSFIRDILVDSDDLTIVDGVVGFATSFDREVIAEGVESLDHGVLLLKLGCIYAQGYVIAKPMPIVDFMKWIEEWELPQEWDNISTIKKEDMSVLVAVVEHRAWLLTIEKYLQHQSDYFDISNIEQCRFGQWLDSKGKEMYGHLPVYDEIVNEHIYIHREAQKIINLDELTDEHTELSKLFEISKALQLKLNNLLKI